MATREELMCAIWTALDGMAPEDPQTGYPAWCVADQTPDREARDYARDVAGLKDMLRRAIRAVIGETVSRPSLDLAPSNEWAHLVSRFHAIFGAPGDWGYHTALGKAVQNLYASVLRGGNT